MGKCTILIVEDEPAITDILRVNLDFEGYHVVCANDAAHAETFVKRKLPGLIILDWTLPGTSGITFARQLRNEKRTQNIPIIMLTAKSLEEDKVKGLN